MTIEVLYRYKKTSIQKPGIKSYLTEKAGKIMVR